MRFVANPPQGVLDAVLRFESSLEPPPHVWVAFGRLAAAHACRRADEGQRARAVLDDALDAYRQAGDRAGEGCAT